MPINEVNTSTFVAPSTVPSKQTGGATRNAPNDVNVRAWNVPTTSSNAQEKKDAPSGEHQSSTRTYIELARDPNGVSLVYGYFRP